MFDKKNVVFIPNIDLGNTRNLSYQYSIQSWEKWCKKNDIELFVWNTLLFPVKECKITWQRHYCLSILKENNIEFDQVAVVDADTIICLDTPNFFNETNNQFCGVLNDGCYEWTNRSIKQYGNSLFSGWERPKIWEYINGGFLVYNITHQGLFNNLLQTYWQHKHAFIKAQEIFKVGTDQTPLNFFLTSLNINVKLLPSCYNLQDLGRKDLLYIYPNCWWEDSLDNLFNSGFIFHFNCIPPNPLKRDANYWIKRVYEEMKKD